ncbi:MAG: hypothetical protein PVI30_04470 [Myxococcales bacterium]|jgi:hypothetical protein
MRTILLVTVLCSMTLAASAQTSVAEATEEQKTRAIAAYEDGKAYYESKDFGSALAAFQKSYAIVASPNTNLMIARCLVQEQRYAEAYATYTATIEGAQVDPEHYAASAQAAEQELATVDGYVGKLQLAVEGADGGTVTVNGRTIEPSQWSRPVPADPGETEVVLASNGQEDRQVVTVTAGETTPVTLTAAPAVSASIDASLGVDGDDAGGPGENPLEKRANLGLIVGGKIGGGIGAPVSELGGTYVLELELGWALPLPAPVNHSIEVFFAGQYAQPETDGTEGEPDARLPDDGTFGYEVTQQMLGLTLGALYRIPVGSELLMPYGGAGARMYLLNTKVRGEAAGESFGENEETQTDIGLVVMGGLEVFVGPGALLGEVSFSWASVDGFVLRDTAVGGLGLSVGYRLII